MVPNHGVNEERLQPRQRGFHTIKETDMLAVKLDLLLRRLDDRPQDKAPTHVILDLDAHTACEVCGNIEHSGNDCPIAHEDVMYMNNNNNINNGFHP
jgi:hypothetical protein